MKKLITLLFITLISCDNNFTPNYKSKNKRIIETTSVNGYYNDISIVTIDSCQYITYTSNGSCIIHKADCTNKIHKLNKK